MLYEVITGSGKTALLDALCKEMRTRFELAVVTNDIYTREDAIFLTNSKALPADRIVGVETGGCPHTAIREDASMNLVITSYSIHYTKLYDLQPEIPPSLDLSHGVILYLEDISVSFDGFKAIDNLNLYINDGELRCIIGPNGAGKTTMMDIITGKTRPDTGSAWFGQQINLLRNNFV